MLGENWTRIRPGTFLPITESLMTMNPGVWQCFLSRRTSLSYHFRLCWWYNAGQTFSGIKAKRVCWWCPLPWSTVHCVCVCVLTSKPELCNSGQTKVKRVKLKRRRRASSQTKTRLLFVSQRSRWKYHKQVNLEVTFILTLSGLMIQHTKQRISLETSTLDVFKNT